MIPDLTKIKEYLLCFYRNLPQFKINSPKRSRHNMSLQSEFNDYRSRMNEVILSKDNLPLKRFFSLDHQMYQDGALSMKTKEMLGLVASMVLRCDDCIRYHLGKCHDLGITTEEIYEIFAIANMVGGSICIPHTRRGAEYWEELISQ
jgi:AhpD family alkylhydroperoxidase